MFNDLISKNYVLLNSIYNFPILDWIQKCLISLFIIQCKSNKKIHNKIVFQKCIMQWITHNYILVVTTILKADLELNDYAMYNMKRITVSELFWYFNTTKDVHLQIWF